MSADTRPRKATVPTRTRLKATAAVTARRTVTRRPPARTDGGALSEDKAATSAVTDAATVPEAAAATEAVAATRAETRTGAGERSTPPARAHVVRRPRIVVAALTIALIAVLVAVGVTGYDWYQQRALSDARQEALAAARQTTVNFVSVSAATVDRDLQRVTAGATGDFKEEFTRGAPQVRAALVENQVDSRGTVLRAGLVSGDRDSAVALVAVDATVKNVKAPQGRLSHYRIQVDLAKDAKSGRWLVSRLQFVG
jgi:Mce-associated membrane protein